MAKNDKIIIRGAREHNLKNIDLTIPRDSLVVMTGLSGSGKSSILRVLAGFDRFASGMVESPSQKLAFPPTRECSSGRWKSPM